MNPSLALRFSAFAALLATAMSARADDAFSNLGTPPNAYGFGGFIINSTAVTGFQFTATASGALTGFYLAMNDYQQAGPQPFSLSLYADDGNNQLDSLLGTFDAMSTGVVYGTQRSALAVVNASSGSVLITTGERYWAVASTTGSLSWEGALSDLQGRRYYELNGIDTYSSASHIGAFSVQVSPVPEPATLAALGLGAIALIRKRRTR